MIISRSSFAGQGKYGSRTLGDNFSTGDYMAYSVTGVMASNIAGVPLAGADICGYNGDTTPELCTRWYTVGSFYPFTRNHNSRDAISQEPYLFTGVYADTSVSFLEIIQNAVHNKMSLIRYYYSEMAHVSRNGGAFFKPLFFDYPDNAEVYAHQNRNAMLGNHVKLGVLSDWGQGGTPNKDIYFPVGVWCLIFNRRGPAGCIDQTTAGTISDSPYPWAYELHLRQGSIIPMQDNKDIQAHNTVELQQEAVELHIHADCSDTSSPCTAQGVYYNDDGETLDPMAFNQYHLQYSQAQGASGNTLTLTNANKNVSPAGRINANDDLDGISIYRASTYGFNTNDFEVTATLDDNSTVQLSDAKYVAQTDRLVYAFGGTASGEK